jgi:hypothetical protein
MTQAGSAALHLSALFKLPGSCLALVRCPEAIFSNNPEVLNTKNTVAIKSADAGVRVRRLGDMKAST